MNKKLILGVLVFTLMFTFYACNNEGAEETDNHAEAGMKDEHADEENHAGEDEHAEELVLTPAQIQEIGIVVKPVKKGNVNARIQRPATVMFNPDKTVQVGPRIEAKVERVLIDLGQKVTQGQSLAVLSSVELGKAKANYLTLLSKLETAEKSNEREKKLYEEKISSESDYLEAKAKFDNVKAELESTKETIKLYGVSFGSIGKTDSPLSNFNLKSSISGVVQKRDLSPGQTISATSTPIHIVDNSQMWTMIDAYEMDIAYVQEGQDIVLTIKSLPGKRFKGKVDWISRSLDKQSRTLKIRAVVPNLQGFLKEGMYGTASIINRTENTSLIIPVDAVQTIENEKVIFVPGDEENSFTTLEVTTGNENNGWIEIAGNIQSGDPVVTEGAFNLMSTLTSRTRSAAHGH